MADNVSALLILYWIVVWHLAHWVADFLLQTKYMALNKSKSLIALGFHVCVYTGVIFGILVLASLGLVLGSTSLLVTIMLYALLTGVFHFVTDYVTSRVSSHYHAKGDMGGFFNTIGADQAVHHILAAVLAYYLFIL